MPLTPRQIWQRHGHLNVTALIRDLAVNGLDNDEVGSRRAEVVAGADILSEATDTPEQIARRRGWNYGTLSSTRPNSAIYRGVPGHPSSPIIASSWEDACRRDNLPLAPVEFWAVSPWLGAQLAAQGERVAPDMAGMAVWARYQSSAELQPWDSAAIFSISVSGELDYQETAEAAGYVIAPGTGRYILGPDTRPVMDERRALDPLDAHSWRWICENHGLVAVPQDAQEEMAP